MRVLALLCIALVTATPVFAAGKNLTLYLDGARVEVEGVAVKGILEVSLPPGMESGSLRVRPMNGSTLATVEVLPAPPDRRMEAEVAHLKDRKEQLTDRLKALEVREEIFRAAAKSQSGKAPRKTKTNREPLEGIRKGTDFALSELEGVFRARRKVEQELKKVESRLEALRQQGAAGGAVARIWFKGKAGRARVSYLQPGLKWIPSYDFRLSGSQGQLVMKALLPKTGSSTAVAVVPARLADGPSGALSAVASEGPVPVGSFRIDIQHEQFSETPQPAVSFTFVNGTGKGLPPGEAICYRQGEYLGVTSFPGLLPGESKEIAFGRTGPGK